MKKNILLVAFATLFYCGYSFAENPDTLTVVKNLEDIVVMPQVKLSPDGASSTDIETEQLANGNAGQNLPVLLSNTPALVVTSDDGLGIGYTYFRVRGTDHTRINMTVNDVPLNESESQTVFWVNMTDMVSSLQNVNVQRGVGTSVNGSAAFGASVNMTTEENTTNTNRHANAELAFSGGMYSTFREMLKVGYKWDNGFYFRGRFSKVNSDGYLERAKSDLLSYSASVGYKHNTTDLHIDCFGGKEKTYMAWDGVSREQIKENRRFNPAGMYITLAGDTGYYNNQTDNYQQHHIQLHLFQGLTNNWILHAALHYTHGQGYYEQLKTDWIRQKHLYNHFYGGLANVTYEHSNILFQTGFALSNYNGQHFGKHFEMDKDYQRIDSTEYEFYRGTGDKLDGNIFARANWKINTNQGHIGLSADMQYRMVRYAIDGINDEDLSPIDILNWFHFFNPKAGITYRHISGHQVYATFAMANREPSRANYTEAGMTQMPQSERLYDYEIGYQKHFVQEKWSLNLGINGYFMDYRNQLVLTGTMSDVGAYLTRNVDKSYRLGAELTLGVTAFDWFKWQGNVCVSRNKIINFADYIDTYDVNWNWIGQTLHEFGNVDIAFSPAITAGSQFTFTTHGFTADISTQVVGKQYLDNTMSSLAMLKPYSKSDVLLSYNLPLADYCPTITIMCQVNNIFNAKYENNGGNYCCYTGNGQAVYSPWFYPQAGINFHAGFRIVY